MYRTDGSYEEYQEEEEEIVEMSEEELLKMLDSQEPALQVCYAVHASLCLPGTFLSTGSISHPGVLQALSQRPASAVLLQGPKPCADHAAAV